MTDASGNSDQAAGTGVPAYRVVGQGSTQILCLNPRLAKEIGMNESIVLMQIIWWVAHVGRPADGEMWADLSLREMQRRAFDFLSVGQIHKVLQSLLKRQLVKTRYDKATRISSWAVDQTGFTNITSVRLEAVQPKALRNKPSAVHNMNSKHDLTVQTGNSAVHTVNDIVQTGNSAEGDLREPKSSKSSKEDNNTTTHVRAREAIPEPVESSVDLPERPPVFAVWEQEVGPLTSGIADELKLLGPEYGDADTADAIRHARATARSHFGPRYVAMILERWKREGKPVRVPDDDPVYVAVVEHVFEGGAGEKAKAVTAWLLGLTDQCGRISAPADAALVPHFVGWYRRKYPTAALPLNLDTFVSNWRKYAKAQSRVTIIPIDAAPPEPAFVPLSDEEKARRHQVRLEAMKRMVPAGVG
jgi:hypothetical protein